MAPSLIAEYSKVLSEFPECDNRELIRVGYMVNSDFAVLRLTEWLLTGSSYGYCLTVSLIAEPDAEWLQEEAVDMHERGESEADIIDYIQRLIGYEPEEEEGVQVARFVYKDFRFRSQNGFHMGVQIKGAFVDPSKEQKGLARRVYSFLLNWHDHIVCDDHQTVYGAKIWAVGMLLVGRVQVYDTINNRFIDVLTEGGVGRQGVKLWDSLQLTSESQLRHWNPMAISINPSSQILAIISAEDRDVVVGISA